MDLKTRIQEDMKTALKARDELRLSALRMLISDIKKREIDKRSAEARDPLDETEIQKAIQTMIKQRAEAAEAFAKGGRPELEAKERAEITVLSSYLPAQLSKDEVEKIVVAAIAESGAKTPADIGKVMKIALAKAGGRADGKLVNELARTKLSAPA